MGIKGIYKEIGPGERISLCKLAVEHLERTGQPFRLAIDFSIWQFQVQAARGGSNPAIRTLFYRLVRLLGLAIQPVFVFDGPNKPEFKRNRRSSGRGDMVATAMAKRLIRLFGFAMHDAPGEAEAECALLQQQGVVDAVLSEDVDTIMFGCRRTLRNWTAEGSKGSKTPTHVSMYEVGELLAGPDGNPTRSMSGLDREGMVLVALMSGGDYLPEGVPGCGVKVACEAARAGFGRDLCRIKKADTIALAAWKERLLHELRTNENGYFRTKHKALEISEDFPRMDILRYYTHPVVSQQAGVDKARAKLTESRSVDVQALRGFVEETFDWTFRIGAVKLIRVLAPSLLVQLLLQRMTSHETSPENQVLREAGEPAIVKAITTQRTHFSTDAMPELRISFVPADIVGLDFESEPEEQVEAFGRTGIALNSDEEFDDGEELGGEQAATGGKRFDPLQTDLAWIPESLVRLGVPLMVEEYEEKQRAKAVQAAIKATKKPRAKKNDMPVGALDKYVKTTKTSTTTVSKRLAAPVPALLTPTTALAGILSQDVARPLHARAIATKATQPGLEQGKSKQSRKPPKPQANKPTTATNPWSIAGSQISPRVTKSIATASTHKKLGFSQQPILISSSPAPPPSPPPLGAALDTQSTPSKAKPDPPCPSPSPRRQTSAGQNMMRKVSGKKSSSSPLPSTRKPRPFKRVKSGTEEDLGITMTQKHITDYGKVVKGGGSDAVVDKKASSAPILMDFLSEEDDDDDSDDGNLPSLQVLLGRKKNTIAGKPVHLPDSPRETFEAGDGEDPFASPKQAEKPQVARLKSWKVTGTYSSVKGRDSSLDREEGGSNQSILTGGNYTDKGDIQYRRSGSRVDQQQPTGSTSKTTLDSASRPLVRHEELDVNHQEHNDDHDPFLSSDAENHAGDDPGRNTRYSGVSRTTGNNRSPFEDKNTTASTEASGGYGNNNKGKQKPKSRWSFSELPVIDLTGED